MKLIEMTVEKYLDVLASDAPAPGGGSVSALTAAQGAALVMMVCDLTIPKERYSQYKEICREVRKEISAIYDELVIAIDKDTEAFNMVSAAYKLPKDTEEEKKIRTEAIQEATVIATRVPYDTMELCLRGIGITAKAVGKSNPNASSDLGVAALDLLAGIKGAYLNVMINLPSIKDENIKAQFVGAEEMVKKAEQAAGVIYGQVLAGL